jgi:alpha-L-fucosidase 2
VQKLLSPERTYPNLFDAHPPFQIDGNFGGAAGILEMLVQSDGRTIHLLPALPSAWPSGRVSGVRCRGGFVVDLEWSESEVRRAVIVSQSDRPVIVRYRGESTSAHLSSGRQWVCPPMGRFVESGVAGE